LGQATRLVILNREKIGSKSKPRRGRYREGFRVFKLTSSYKNPGSNLKRRSFSPTSFPIQIYAVSFNDDVINP